MRTLALIAFGLATFVSCKKSDDAAPRGEATPPNGTGSSSSGGATDAHAPGPSDAGDASKPLGVPRVYVGSADGKIRLFSFDAGTGALTLVDAFAAGKNPSFLAMHPDQNFLYAVDEDASLVQAFAVDRASGKLSPLGTVSSGGAGPAHLSLDHAGTHVLVANYGGGTITVLPRGADGRLGAPTDSRSFGSDAMTHEILTDPFDTFVLVPNKGHDAVSVFKWSASNGKLSDVSLDGYPAGDGARHVAFDAKGTHVYVTDELGSTVTVMTMDRTTGALATTQTISMLPSGFSGTNTAAEIQLTSDGAHVLASNRGDDSIVVFDVNAADGKLTKKARVPTGGATPRMFSIEPSGRFLFVGNQGSGNVVVMKMDATTGVPSPVGSPVSVPSPAFVGLYYF